MVDGVRKEAPCRTSMRKVWAIGDLTDEPMLAHRSMAQGEMVVEIISGKRRHFAPAGAGACTAYLACQKFFFTKSTSSPREISVFNYENSS